MRLTSTSLLLAGLFLSPSLYAVDKMKGKAETIFRNFKSADEKKIFPHIQFPIEVLYRSYRLNKGMCETYEKKSRVDSFSALKPVLAEVNTCWEGRSRSDADLAEAEQNGISEGWEYEIKSRAASKTLGTFVGWSTFSDCVHLCGVFLDKSNEKASRFVIDDRDSEWNPKRKDFKFLSKAAITN